MEGGGELTAYEQERQRRLEENRRKLEEMGLQQVGRELTPFERQLERRRRAPFRIWVACRIAMQRAASRRRCPRPCRPRRRWSTPAPTARRLAHLPPAPPAVPPARRW